MDVRRLGIVVALAAIAGCETEATDPPATTAPGSSDPTPVLVPGLATLADRTARPTAPPRISPGDGFRIEDAPALRGDPAACAAFHACCDGVNGQLTPSGLACGLAPAAANGDCTRAVESVRAILVEQKIPPPPGCE